LRSGVPRAFVVQDDAVLDGDDLRSTVTRGAEIVQDLSRADAVHFNFESVGVLAGVVQDVEIRKRAEHGQGGLGLRRRRGNEESRQKKSAAPEDFPGYGEFIKKSFHGSVPFVR